MNDIIKILKLLECSNVLIDGITETVKHEIKKQEEEFIPAFLAPLAASLVQPVISAVVKYMSGTRNHEEEDIWIKMFICAPSFKQYRDD